MYYSTLCYRLNYNDLQLNWRRHCLKGVGIENGTFISTDGVECHFRDGATGFVSFTGLANISADSLTSVMVDTTMGADLDLFNWTYAKEKGAL